MTAECPVSYETVDERVARGVALVVIAAAAVFVATPLKWVAGALTVDFLLRAFVAARLSPLAFAVRTFARGIGLAPRPTDAAPKRFAAGVGALFSAGALALHLAGLPTGAVIVASALAACATLEGVFGFCVGCWVYTLLKPLLGRASGSATPEPDR